MEVKFVFDEASFSRQVYHEYLSALGEIVDKYMISGQDIVYSASARYDEDYYVEARNVQLLTFVTGDVYMSPLLGYALPYEDIVSLGEVIMMDLERAADYMVDPAVMKLSFSYTEVAYKYISSLGFSRNLLADDDSIWERDYSDNREEIIPIVFPPPMIESEEINSSLLEYKDEYSVVVDGSSSSMVKVVCCHFVKDEDVSAVSAATKIRMENNQVARDIYISSSGIAKCIDLPQGVSTINIVRSLVVVKPPNHCIHGLETQWFRVFFKKLKDKILFFKKRNPLLNCAMQYLEDWLSYYSFPYRMMTYGMFQQLRLFLSGGRSKIWYSLNVGRYVSWVDCCYYDRFKLSMLKRANEGEARYLDEESTLEDYLLTVYSPRHFSGSYEDMLSYVYSPVQLREVCGEG